jgi:hypothetical protein
MSNELVKVEIDESEQVRVSEEVSQAVSVLHTAQSFKVKCKDDADFAAKIVNDIAPRIKALEDARKELTRPLDASKKGIMALFAKAIDPLTEAMGIFKRKNTEWLVNERSRIQKLQDIEDAKAAAKQQKLEEKIATAEDAGDLNAAERLRDKAANVVSKILEVPKVEGMKVKNVWKGFWQTGMKEDWKDAEMSDKMFFLKYVVSIDNIEHLCNVLSAIDVKMSPLVDVARTTEGKAVIPGIKFIRMEALTR